MEPILEGTPEQPRGRGRALVAIALAALVLGSGSLWFYRRAGGGHAGHEHAGTYYCPMHPTSKADKPGKCPICSMKLIPLEGAPAPGAGTPFAGGGMASQASGPGAADTFAPAAPSTAAGPPPRVRIAPERQQQIGVKFTEAMRMPANVEIRAVGHVAYDETQIAHVHTKVSGWIEDVFVDFVGAPVRRGQPLFTIYSPELVSSQEEYLLALRARDELGGSSFARVAEGSRTLLDSARRRLELWDMTSEQIEALEKKGSVSRTVTVHSHVSGVVTERMAYHHGKTVTPDMDLYTIVDLSRVWVQAEVYEYEVAHVRVGQAAEISLPYDSAKKSLRGKVMFVAPFVDPKTRTVQVRMEFPNPDSLLRPEAFVNVTLRRDLGPRLVVPKDAVMDTGQAQYVFVDQGDGYLEPREVKAGPEVADGRVIEEGIKEGERVATAANFILDSESRLKGAFDAMGRPIPVEATRGSAAQITADITTNPSPARIGRNQVRVKVKDAQGQPITDGEVDIQLFMPQMIGMAEVNVKAPLRTAGNGEYVGDVELPIAWSFATTVTVRKGGQVVGTAETTVTSR
jgi:Cu(I)/Ag(I) efflux system membrane fusion protein